MSEQSFMYIAESFIGNIENTYSYKNGESLVNFFNTNFNYDDIYKMGFPSRRIYTAEKLREIYLKEEFDAFLNIILSKDFIITDKLCSEKEALYFQSKILELFNMHIRKDGYQIYEILGKFFLKKIDLNMEQIGEGGFAIVYHNKLTNLVHKKLKDDLMRDKAMISRFKREYEITMQLQDLENIIKVYDYNNITNEYIMEYGEENLYEYINKSNLTQEEKIEIVLIILRTMSEVHKRQIIHRDLSPTNMLFINGKLKIADFGLGKNLEMFHSHKTIYTNMFGQYQYCDPEQYMSLKEGDMQSDVYSLGRIINFVFTRSPLDSNHYFKYICEKAISADRIYRFYNASEMLCSIEETINKKAESNRMEFLLNKIQNMICDNEVEEWIYEMDGVELSRNIIADKYFYAGILLFMKNSNNNTKYIIDTIINNYKLACKTYSDYDVFAYIATSVLEKDIDFEYKEKSCNILNNIAYNVNRFSIQRVIDKIINDGIDPLLEEMLIKR